MSRKESSRKQAAGKQATREQLDNKQLNRIKRMESCVSYEGRALHSGRRRYR